MPPKLKLPILICTTLLGLTCGLTSCLTPQFKGQSKEQSKGQSNEQSNVVSNEQSNVVSKDSKRDPAQVSAPTADPVLKYVTYKVTPKGAVPHVETIDPVRWLGTAGGFSQGGRQDYLIKMYSANTKTFSNRGLRHAACFEGSAQDVAHAFFQTALPYQLEVRPSQDGQMLGLAFSSPTAKGKLKPHFFRMQNCSAGKEPMIADQSRLPNAVAKPEGAAGASGVAGAQTLPSAPITGKFSNLPHHLYGFMDIDQAINPSQVKVPSFELKTDFANAVPRPNDRPWRGLDVRQARGALMLSVLAQKYIYENMGNQNRDPNLNFIAPQNKERYWCHMPWLNVGASGREAVHGLTKERDLYPSPNMKLFKSTGRGTDWGVAYYNAYGCKAIGEIFGSKAEAKTTPDFTQVEFPDGTLAAKILFTTADFPEIKKAFTWDANVSGVGETNRTVQPVRHIQMDIAIKDREILGVKSGMKDWLMLTYYYDPSYDYLAEYKALTGEESPLAQVKNLPEGLLKMRPMGVQTGFEGPETGDSLIFAGAETNGLGGRLNGPADNPKSSCFSCHGTAGTSRPMVPGFLKNADFDLKDVHLDFSQQVSLAKRNLETYISTPAGEN